MSIGNPLTALASIVKVMGVNPAFFTKYLTIQALKAKENPKANANPTAIHNML